MSELGSSVAEWMASVDAALENAADANQINQVLENFENRITSLEHPIPPPVDPPVDPPTGELVRWDAAPPSKDGYIVYERPDTLPEAYAPTFTITLDPPGPSVIQLGELHSPNFANPRKVRVLTDDITFDVQLESDQFKAVDVPTTSRVGLRVVSVGDQNVPLFSISAEAGTTISVKGGSDVVVPPPPNGDPPPDITPDVVLRPGEPVNLRGATDAVVGWEPGTVVGPVDLEGAKRFTFLSRGHGPLVVAGALDSSGPLQSGTVNLWRTEDGTLEDVHCMDSPRSAFSVEHAANLTLRRITAAGAWHLGLHGGFTEGIKVLESLFEDNSRRIGQDGESSAGWESGHLKLARANDPQVLDSTFRLGYGPAIWFDIECHRGNILRNKIFEAWSEAIFWEISGEALIADNYIRNSPTGPNMSRMSWLYGAAILVSTSSGVDVLRNDIEGSYHGITVIDQSSSRADTPPGYDAADYQVVANVVANVNKVGAGQDRGGSGRVFNRDAWRDNSYSGVKQFVWEGGAHPEA